MCLAKTHILGDVVLQIAHFVDNAFAFFFHLMQCVHKHLLLTLGKKAQTGVLHYSEPKRVIHRCCGLFLLFCRGHQLSGWRFSVALDTLAFTMLTECGHKSPWQPPNVVWAFSILKAVHLWMDDSVLGLDRLWVYFRLSLQFCFPVYVLLGCCLCLLVMQIQPMRYFNWTCMNKKIQESKIPNETVHSPMLLVRACVFLALSVYFGHAYNTNSLFNLWKSVFD